MSDETKGGTNFVAFLLEKLGVDPRHVPVGGVTFTPMVFATEDYICVEWKGEYWISIREFNDIVREHELSEADRL